MKILSSAILVFFALACTAKAAEDSLQTKTITITDRSSLEKKSIKLTAGKLSILYFPRGNPVQYLDKIYSVSVDEFESIKKDVSIFKCDRYNCVYGIYAYFAPSVTVSALNIPLSVPSIESISSMETYKNESNFFVD